MQKNLRDNIVAKAKDYLQRYGFSGFSFQDLANDIGLRKASLHYYFKSKEELGLVLIEEYRNAFERWTQAMQNKNAREKLDGMFHIFVLMAKDGKKICPTGALTTELQKLPASMQKKLREFHEEQKQWLLQTLIDGQREGIFNRSLAAGEYADLLLAIFQGGIQIARLRGNIDSMKDSYESLRKVLTSALKSVS